MKRTRVERLVLTVLAALVVASLVSAWPRGLLQAQSPLAGDAETQARRVSDRIRALQSEAERLAAQSKTLIGDLRKLEIERDLAAERSREAEAATVDAQQRVLNATTRLAQLEQQRVAQLPDLRAQLVDVYKRGRGGYARVLLQADSLRDLGRTARAVSALARINQLRIEAHRRTVDALRAERMLLEEQAARAQGAELEARQARVAAERAATARARLIDEIDARRDLTAQLAGELQDAYDRLQRQISDSSPLPGAPSPIAGLRGALEWPLDGRVTAVGSTSGGTALAARQGVEIAAAPDTAVVAVHGGTVTYAEPFTGFGNLVIVDHGGNSYALYGYLSSTSVEKGARVEPGTELGRVGSAPSGPIGLYFELLVDGRSVDPVQWLRPR